MFTNIRTKRYFVLNFFLQSIRHTSTVIFSYKQKRDIINIIIHYYHRYGRFRYVFFFQIAVLLTSII